MTDVRLQPAAQTRAPVTPKQAGISAVLLLAASLVITPLMSDEGKWNVAKRDFAQGIPTECFGHTGVDVKLGEHRTDAQCQALLTSDVRTIMDGVVACTPSLAERPQQLAAATRLAYNIGTAAFCHSGTASAFRREEWRKGCDLMLAWDKAHVGGKLVRVAGLAARRQRERAMCLTRLAA